jgi:hypothetical protein
MGQWPIRCVRMMRCLFMRGVLGDLMRTGVEQLLPRPVDLGQATNRRRDGAHWETRRRAKAHDTLELLRTVKTQCSSSHQRQSAWLLFP